MNPLEENSEEKNHQSTVASARRQTVQSNHLMSWVTDHIKTPKGDVFDWDNHPYLLDIYEDPAKDMVLKKAAQIGISTFGMNKALWFTDTENVSVIYTLPTAGDVSNFSKARINPMIQGSDYLSSRLTGNIDSVELKQIGESFLYLRGAWSERQAISVDSDFNIHDEIDFSKPDIIEIYKERTSHSKWKWFLSFSTPTIPEFGIDYLFNRSDKKEWFVTCPNCKKKQILKYPDSIRGDTAEARFACIYCRATITDDCRREGEWIATGDKKWGRSGYHISQLMAPWITATDILRKEEQSRIRPTKNLSGLKDFYNFCLGEAYGGENQPINRDLLLSCIQNKYDLELKGKNTVMGVDQGDNLHVTIWKKEKDGTLRPIHIGVYKSFEDLPNLMDAYGVVFCVIDALPNKHSARKFANMYPAKVWLVYYNDNQKEFIKWYKDPESKEYRVIVSKMESVDRMADRFVNHIVVLPRLSQETDLLMRHLCNWAKDKEEKPDGRIVWVYKKLGADHLTMATNYAMLGLDRISTGSLAEPKPDDVKKADKPITSDVLSKSF
jgi:hypothetical protein